MAEQEIDSLLRRMPDIAKAVNAFESEPVQQAALSALIGAFEVGLTKIAIPRHPSPSPSSPHSGSREEASDEPVNANSTSKGVKRSKRRKAAPSATESRSEAFVEKVDKSLSTPGLREYYAQWTPKNHPEKVLIFTQYLKDQGHEPCTANQIFTCYTALRIPRPKAFIQAIRDAHGSRNSFLDYKSPTDITVTTIGEDHLWHHMKKADGG